MTLSEISKLEGEIALMNKKLQTLRAAAPRQIVRNYKLQNLQGPVALHTLFGDKETLIVIHNMGRGCNYCTLWADGINAFLPYLETQAAVVLVSKDDPQSQHEFASSRQWRFRMASHGGGEYIRELVFRTKSDGLVTHI